MTATIHKAYDVFISHGVSDKQLVSEVAECLESVGLETFHEGSIEPGSDRAEAIWNALAESRALIAIISPDTPTQAMGMVEIGAATVWNKPVFLLINGPSTAKLPPALSLYPVYPLSRLEDVVRAIQTGFDPLTDNELETLTTLYTEVNTPTDQLTQSPKALRKLTTHFNNRTKKQYSGERLLSELIRMRKKGDLPALRTRK